MYECYNAVSVCHAFVFTLASRDTTRSGLSKVTCSCVGKSAAACKTNDECNVKLAKAAAKYVLLPRSILIPPQTVAPMPLSFFKVHEPSLRSGTKIETRRGWKSMSFIKSQQRALAKNLFVRAWCGAKGTHIGYLMYHDIRKQRLGDMTLADVKAEGWEGMSLVDFKKTHLPHSTKDDVLWVIHFTFMPLC